MKKLRIALLIFFMIVAVVFGIRTVRNYITRDVEAPVITCDTEAMERSVEVTEEELLKGMKATDNKDGDVTDSLVVVSRSKFIEPGTVKVNYAAFDSHNNVGVYSRRLTYTDYAPPRFSMTQPLMVRQSSSSYEIWAGIRAKDCIDGDISGQVRMTYDNGNSRFVMTASDSEVDTEIEISVTNSVGDTVSLPVTVRYMPDKLYEQPAPALKEYLIYLKKGEFIKPKEYIKGIWSAGRTYAFGEGNAYSEKDIRIISEDPDYNTPGVYQVEFQLIDTKTKSIDEEEVRTRTELGTNVLYIVVED